VSLHYTIQFPWNRPREVSPPPPTESAASPVAGLEARISALEQRHAQAAADVGLLRVEWAEVLDKISHWASRQSGREAKKAKASLDNLAQDAPGDTIAAHPAPRSKAELRTLLSQRRSLNGG